MSHKATSWAFKVRGLSSSQRVVLIFLADCHCPDHGCHSSLASIARWSELDLADVQGILQSLKTHGHIRIAEGGDDRVYLAFEFGLSGETRT